MLIPILQGATGLALVFLIPPAMAYALTAGLIIDAIAAVLACIQAFFFWLGRVEAA